MNQSFRQLLILHIIITSENKDYYYLKSNKVTMYSGNHFRTIEFIHQKNEQGSQNSQKESSLSQSQSQNQFIHYPNYRRNSNRNEFHRVIYSIDITASINDLWNNMSTDFQKNKIQLVKNRVIFVNRNKKMNSNQQNQAINNNIIKIDQRLSEQLSNLEPNQIIVIQICPIDVNLKIIFEIQDVIQGFYQIKHKQKNQKKSRHTILPKQVFNDQVKIQMHFDDILMNHTNFQELIHDGYQLKCIQYQNLFDEESEVQDKITTSKVSNFQFLRQLHFPMMNIMANFYKTITIYVRINAPPSILQSVNKAISEGVKNFITQLFPNDQEISNY